MSEFASSEFASSEFALSEFASSEFASENRSAASAAAASRAAARCAHAATPTPDSNAADTTAATPLFLAAAAAAAHGSKPPSTDGFNTNATTPNVGSKNSAVAAATDVPAFIARRVASSTDSSSATGTPVVQWNAARSSRHATGSSTYSRFASATCKPNVNASLSDHRRLASARSRTSGPTARRTARRRAASARAPSAPSPRATLSFKHV